MLEGFFSLSILRFEDFLLLNHHSMMAEETEGVLKEEKRKQIELRREDVIKKTQ